MNINDILFKSEFLTEKILSYLDAKSLAYFGSCCRKWRILSNSNRLWLELCKLKGFEKYNYLINTDSHPSIPAKTTTVSPAYKKINETEMNDLCDWHEIYNRSMHLIKNWKLGIYFVCPVIKAHNGPISAFDSNGSVMVSTSSTDKLVKVWSVNDSDCLNSFKVKTDTINCLKIYNDFIVCGGEEGVIRLYDLFDGDLKHFLSNNASSGTITKFVISNDKIAVVYSDKSIRVWCLKKFKLLFILRSHTDEIECLASQEDILVTGSWDKNLILWDLNHGSKLVDLTGHSEVVTCIKIKNLNTFISGSSDSTLKIWNLSISKSSKNKNEKLMLNSVDSMTLKGHDSDVYCVDSLGEYIASGGADSVVIVWNFYGDLLYKLTGHLGIVRFMLIDEHKLVTGGDAKRILVWDYKNGKLLNTLHRNPNKLNSMWLNDTKIITTSPDIESNITLICYW